MAEGNRLLAASECRHGLSSERGCANQLAQPSSAFGGAAAAPRAAHGLPGSSLRLVTNTKCTSQDPALTATSVLPLETVKEV